MWTARSWTARWPIKVDRTIWNRVKQVSCSLEKCNFHANSCISGSADRPGLLAQFLASQVEAFDAAAGNDQSVVYNIGEVFLPYSDASENHGTIIEGIHLELLVDLPEHPNAGLLGDPWKVRLSFQLSFVCWFN